MKISNWPPVAALFIFLAAFVSLQAQDNPAQAAARAALMRQMNQMQAPEPTPPPHAPAPPMTVVPPMAAPADTSTINQPPVVAEPAVPVTAASPEMVSPGTNDVPVAPVMKPASSAPISMDPPALPVSMSKEQRLQTLLMLYKADQITPEQYHTRRAAILAEP